MKLAQWLFKNFSSTFIKRFPWISNIHVYALATLDSSVNSDMKRTIKIKYLPSPSIDAEQDCLMVFDVEADLGVSWMDPIIQFLINGSLPNDSGEAQSIRPQANQYWLSPDQKLCRRSFSGPYLKCVHPKKMHDVLFELHEESYWSHTGSRSLTHWARSQVLLWGHFVNQRAPKGALHPRVW